MKANIEEKIKFIVEKGNEYKKKYLDQYNKDTLLTDSWEALKFYFERSFMRGRKNELSNRFKNAAIKALQEFKISEKLEELKINGWLDEKNFKSNENPLQKVLQEARVNNRGDRLMVIETLSFVSDLNEKNIIKWTVEQIKNGKIKEVYMRLISIPWIGDKLASFFIRDTVDLYELESYLSPNDFIFTQPIDTWVRQVCSELGIITGELSNKKSPFNKDRTQIKQAILRICNQFKVSPIKFNQGAWYVGFHREKNFTK
jgi:hypothetical protein